MRYHLPARLIGTALCSLGLFTMANLNAQTSDQPSSSSKPEKIRESQQREKRFSFGFRVRGFPWELIQSRTQTVSYPNPVESITYQTTPFGRQFGGGLTLELVLTRHILFSAEALYTHVRYSKITNLYVGTDNTATTADERKLTTTNEFTEANFWDIPLMFRFQGLRSSGVLSKIYFSGGATLRHVGNVKTNSAVIDPEDNVTYSTAPASTKRNLLGTVFGLGMRFTDDFNIHVTPEARYTMWRGYSFNGDSTLTRKGQVEIGLGFTF